MKISSVCVYCSASDHVAQHYKELAKQVGTQLARSGYQMVYGGAEIGLMGLVADAAMTAGGRVVGVIPHNIRSDERPNANISELHIVSNMHDRKQIMVNKSDAFLILPGGFGTLDETFEILTWRQLKFHNKPVVLLNHQGYWDSFVALARKIVSEGFASQQLTDLFYVANTIDDALSYLKDKETAGIASPANSM